MSAGLSDIEIKALREQFPVLHQEVNKYPLVYFDNAASTQKPRLVIDAISDYYLHHHSNVHRGVHHLSNRATDKFEAAREKVKDFIGATSADEIIWTRGTTESINLVASSWARNVLKPGDEILISVLEHHSNIVPWQMVCEATGAVLKTIPMLADGSLNMQAYADLLNPSVKLVAIGHVSNALGSIHPVEQIISSAHAMHIPVLLDGAQAVPHLSIDVQKLDVDFYAFSGHKVYGPTGIGILYAKASFLESMTPYQGGGEMISRVTFEKTTYNRPPFRFEAGTPNIAGAIGMGSAIDFVKQVGIAEIAAHETALLQYATRQMLQIKGLRLIGTSPKKSAVISFLLEGAHPYDVGVLLDKQGIAVRTGHHCAEPLMDLLEIPGTVRASFAVYNTFEEIDRFIEALHRTQKILGKA
jgi:cysteine desulfurase/selenocysteine lyase